MAQQGEINIISKPRITTLNNQRAIIKIGTEEVYFEAETQTGTATTTIVYTPKFFTVGVVLDVTPQIGPGDELTLHIHPVISEKVGETPYPSSVGIGGEATIPIVSIRESSSVVKVKSGQTLVLAGLLTEKTSETVTGVPGLMHLPLVGRLFRYRRTEKRKTELVVTLTPTILAGKGMDEFRDDELTRIFVTDEGR
jgi:type II secretory pathway component GspD/PulD (secretin)